MSNFKLGTEAIWKRLLSNLDRLMMDFVPNSVVKVLEMDTTPINTVIFVSLKLHFL